MQSDKIGLFEFLDVKKRRNGRPGLQKQPEACPTFFRVYRKRHAAAVEAARTDDSGRQWIKAVAVDVEDMQSLLFTHNKFSFFHAKNTDLC